MAHPWLWLVAIVWLAALGVFYWRERGRPGNQLWRDLLAGGILFLLTAGFFWRTLSGAVYQPADGGDLASFLFPTYRFAAGELAQGRLPLWNPTLYGGAPFVGDIQAGFLYVPNLLLFLLAPEFPYAALQWSAAGHLFWAALGMYTLLRALRWPDRTVGRLPALFGAVAFSLSDPLLIHFGNLNLIAVLSWLPWVLAAYARTLETRRLRWLAGAALLFAAGTYAGHAQSTLYTGLALIVYTVGWTATNLPPAGARARSVLADAGVLAGVLVLTGLLAAPILLPALELTRHALRQAFTYQDSVAYSLAPTQLLAGLVSPGFFGHGPALHWSLWERVELPFAGVATLVFGLAGLLLSTPEQRRRLWPWLGMALFGLVTALGVYAIVHGWLTFLVPLFDQFRAPARATVLWVLGLAVMAALGVEAVATGERRSPALGKILLGGAGLLGLGVVLNYLALLFLQTDETVFLRASVAALALVFAFAFWLLAWALIAARQAQVISQTALGVLAILLLYLDLAAAGAYTDISPTDPTQGFHHPEIVEYLRSDPDLFRIDSRTGIETLWQPDTAALAGLQDVGGIANPLALRSFTEFWESTGGRATRRYDLLNVKYVIAAEGTPLPAGKFERVLGSVNGLELYRNRDFVPRAWVAPGGVDLATIEPPPTPGGATVTAYGSTAMTVQAEAPQPGYLILSELWYPGWTATVDGAAAPISQAVGALRAVPVPAGSSTVELRFWPATWSWGLILAAAGAVLALLALFWPERRSRRRSG